VSFTQVGLLHFTLIFTHAHNKELEVYQGNLGLSVHLEAPSSTMVYLDVLQQRTVNGGPVGLWKDTSAFGGYTHAVRASAKPVRFLGVEEAVQIVPGSSLLVQAGSSIEWALCGKNVSWFVVLRTDGVGTANIVESTDVAGNVVWGSKVTRTQGAAQPVFTSTAGSAKASSSSTSSASARTIVSGVWSADGKFIQYINGMASAASNATNTECARDIHLGSSSSTSLLLVYEVILYNTTLSDADRVLVERYSPPLILCCLRSFLFYQLTCVCC
jgi:hypothetical protein